MNHPSDPHSLEDLARSALDKAEEERALPLLNEALRARPSARLFQWKGLLERSLDAHEQAIASFEEAARLDPSDASIAHGRARVALEAGLPAEHLFEQARRLAPADGSVLLGLAAARLAAGRGEEAETELDTALLHAPLWIEGHFQLAQLRSMLGRREMATASFERALRDHPGHSGLWQALFELQVKREAFESLEEAVSRGERNDVDALLLTGYKTIAAAELGKTESADRLFAQIEAAGRPVLPIWKIRHLLRTGRVEQALPLIDRELAGPGAANAWPYAAIAWRLAGDSRSNWLEQDGRLVHIVDLGDELPPLKTLAEVLRSIHVARGEYLDQSVRGGTQTDGPLFSRIEPEIRAVRSAVTAAITQYVANLPKPEAGHPMLSARRDRRVRFSGSWSVRLKGRGFHASHVHPQGWISSALYVALPDAVDADDPHAGWLQLGMPPDGLSLDLAPTQCIRPEPGRLVLFPSWMWHGTIPFPAGERLTIAFDVAVPR